jgi:hypothetical protein
MLQTAGGANNGQEPDPSWRSLYQAGAIAVTLAVVMYIVALILFVVTPAPPTFGGAPMLEYVAANRTTYIIKQVLWLAPSALMIVLFLALAVALKQLDQTLALLAGVIGVVSWAGTFAWPATGDGSLVFLMLADDYLAAPVGERVPFVSAAETLIAFNDVPAPLGVMQAVSVFLIALLMLRGVFSKGVAWLGVATGIVGIVSEALRPWLGWAYAGYGLLLFVWMIWVGWVLWRLGRETPVIASRHAGLVQESL